MTWGTDVGAPGIGDNQPPEDIDPLVERLAEEYGWPAPDEPQLGKPARLGEIAQRLLEAETRIPASLTEETLGRCTDYGRQLKKLIKKVEEARRSEKEPFLASGRTVDNWFAEIREKLREIAARVETRVEAFLRAKELEERRRREAEARELEKEARALAKEGEHQLAQETRADARELKAEARTANPADLVRTHTGLGGVATLRRVLDFEINDKQAAVSFLWRYIDADAVGIAIRQFCRDGGVTVEHIDARQKEQPIPGVRLYVSRKASF